MRLSSLLPSLLLLPLCSSSRIGDEKKQHAIPSRSLEDSIAVSPIDVTVVDSFPGSIPNNTNVTAGYVTHFRLMDTTTNTSFPEYDPLVDGAVVILNGNMSGVTVQAVTEGVVGSLKFVESLTVENHAPYARCGDVKGRYLRPCLDLLIPGPHQVTALLYAEPNRTGPVVSMSTVNFTVVAGEDAPVLSGEGISALRLIHTPTQEVLMDLYDGAVIDVAAFNVTSEFNIHAVREGNLTDSVLFLPNERGEGGQPYSYCGDVNGYFQTCSEFRRDGNHTISVVPFVGKEQNGAVLPPLSVSFSIIGTGASPFSLRLIHTPTNAAIMDLYDGAVVDVAALNVTPEFNLLAVHQGNHDGSVIFLPNEREEDVEPYSYCGDANGFFDSCSEFATDGNHTISVIPFTGNNQTGAVLPTLTVNFSIINTVSGQFTLRLIHTPTQTVLMDLYDGAVVDVAALNVTSEFNLHAVHQGNHDGSVLFLPNGRGEDEEPYSYCGDADGIFVACPEFKKDGSYTVSLVPFVGNNQTGAVLPTLKISFDVINTGSSPLVPSPTGMPTVSPTGSPATWATSVPTKAPVNAGPLVTVEPTTSSPVAATLLPSPTKSPSVTALPTEGLTLSPTEAPLVAPTKQPIAPPTLGPTASPTGSPTPPTVAPTAAPTASPTPSPTVGCIRSWHNWFSCPPPPPTLPPIQLQSPFTTDRPTKAPTTPPTKSPTAPPTKSPTGGPTRLSTDKPTGPTRSLTSAPSKGPTTPFTKSPTKPPTVGPTSRPTKAPTSGPTQPPTSGPTQPPTRGPTRGPTKAPTSGPTQPPTRSPTLGPTQAPTSGPTQPPTRSPTSGPTKAPTSGPTQPPTRSPTLGPTKAPTKVPTSVPNAAPVSTKPTSGEVPPPPLEIGKWIETNADAPIDERHEACFVMVGTKAYLVGGRGDKNVDIYDPVTRSWSVGARPPIQMHHMQCVAARGLLWVVSAWTDWYPEENNAQFAYVYDPATDLWSTRTAIPENRRRGGAAVIVSEDESKIYVSHGNNGGHETGNYAVSLGYLDEYDIATDTWTPLSDDAPNPRDHTGGALINGKVCVAGGRNGGELNWPEVAPTDCYDLATGTWSEEAPIPQVRGGSSYGTTCDGKLMVAGGEGGGKAWPDVDVFDGQSWTRMADLVVPRHGSGLAFNCRCDQIYIASGSAGQGGGPEIKSIETYFSSGVDTPCLP